MSRILPARLFPKTSLPFQLLNLGWDRMRKLQRKQTLSHLIKWLQSESMSRGQQSFTYGIWGWGLLPPRRHWGGGLKGRGSGAAAVRLLREILPSLHMRCTVESVSSCKIASAPNPGTWVWPPPRLQGQHLGCNNEPHPPSITYPDVHKRPQSLPSLYVLLLLETYDFSIVTYFFGVNVGTELQGHRCQMVNSYIYVLNSFSMI